MRNIFFNAAALQSARRCCMYQRMCSLLSTQTGITSERRIWIQINSLPLQCQRTLLLFLFRVQFVDLYWIALNRSAHTYIQKFAVDELCICVCIYIYIVTCSTEGRRYYATLLSLLGNRCLATNSRKARFSIGPSQCYIWEATVYASA
jgi:hypothetical protein